MVCRMCGFCCYAGFYNSRLVAEGLLRIKPQSVIDYLSKEGIIISFDDSLDELIAKLLPYEACNTFDLNTCLFLNIDNKCVIHPSIIGENIRGKACSIKGCYY